MTNGLSQIKEEIEKLVSYIETAERLIYQGQIVDIATLETRITELCQTLDRLPPNKANDLLEDMEKLFSVIERLEKDIDLQHDALTERLQFSGTHANPLMAQEVTDEED